MHGHAELSKHARLHCRGGFERVRADVFVDLAIRELHESRVDALCLSDLQARVLVNAEGLDVRNERRILPLPSTAWRALTLGERKRLARIAEGATRRILQLELVAVWLPHEVGMETGRNASHLDAFRARRAPGALESLSTSKVASIFVVSLN